MSAFHENTALFPSLWQVIVQLLFFFYLDYFSLRRRRLFSTQKGTLNPSVYLKNLDWVSLETHGSRLKKQTYSFFFLFFFLNSIMSCKLWVCEARCCYEGWGCGPAINDSIRSSSNNDNRNNTDSPTLLTARAEGARGERETQFLETDWENITFLELCLLLLLLSLHLTIILFTATSTLTLIHHHHPPLSLPLLYTHWWDSPVCVWVW